MNKYKVIAFLLLCFNTLAQTPSATKIANLEVKGTSWLKGTTDVGILATPTILNIHAQSVYGTDSTFLYNGSTANLHRIAMGVAIGTDVQAYDADLTTWSGITPAGGVDTFLSSPSSANLLAATTDETGTGSLVFQNTPTFKTEVCINNPANTFKYRITPAAIAADRILNLPLLTATDTLVSEGFIQTLTNKTLTAPKIVSGGFIADANGNESLIFTTTASATNEFTMANAATGSSPTLSITGSSDTNIGLNIRTKGTGSISITPPPDGTQVAPSGALGASSVDWQVFRTTAGNYSIGQYSAVIAGYNGRATSTNSLSVGGLQGIASGANATTLGGYTNTASATYSAALGGYTLTASGAQSSAVGGQLNAASGVDSSVFGGKEATANRIGMNARASGKFTTVGDNQSGLVMMRTTTSGVTPVELTLDGAAAADGAVGTSNRFQLSANTVIVADITVTACSTNSANRASYVRRITVYRSATNIVLSNSQTIGTDYESDTNWDFTIDVLDGANDCFRLFGTGTAATNIRWMARVEFNELTSP